jgi:serine/threonine protein kinase
VTDGGDRIDPTASRHSAPVMPESAALRSTLGGLAEPETDRDEPRRFLPPPEDDAIDELEDELARSQFRAEKFGVVADVRVDRYVIRRRIDGGGMGVVFEAHDPVLMIPVAFKLLRARAGDGTGDGPGPADDVKRQREAQALASVEGDHVVRVYSAGFHKRQPWIAMQFVSGPNLADWLRYQRQHGDVGWRSVLPKFIDAARGLIAVHDAGLVHRDFKPQNAVVDARGRVRVLDFGLATADRRPVAAATTGDLRRGGGQTSTGALVGTLRYASPEQFVGTDLDHRSDQFSFNLAPRGKPHGSI